MKLAVNIRTEPFLTPVPRREGEILPREDFDRQIEIVTGNLSCSICTWLGASIPGGLQLPAWSTGEHAVVEHHAFVDVLPVQGDELGTSAPVEGWVEVG